GAYVRRTLRNRSLLGELQPYELVGGQRKPTGSPIANYYPPVLDQGPFDRVQEQLAANRKKGGQIGRAHNLLVHLARWAYCGAAMNIETKVPKRRSLKYLACVDGKAGVRDAAGKPKCSAACRIRYEECEQLLLDNCPKLRPEQVLPNPDEA